MTATDTLAREPGQDFIRDIVRADLEAGRTKSVITRFPPEPNGYLHIGHAKSICLNFGVAEEFGGRCNLRFDDTNPTKEEQEYIDAIERDVRWLGFDWGEHLYHASDYFEQLYAWAEHLIGAGKAYIDDQTQEEMRASRGTLTEPGRNSPYREPQRGGEPRPLPPHARGRIPERRARAARQDRHGLRQHQPARPRALPHPARQPTRAPARQWCIYPSYDYAHGQSDALEGVTHSICTLEFEDHRPLYDWFLDNLPVPSRPRQYEFARLNMSYTVLSKRVLTELVRGGHVAGWDDPRMPTLAGLRRRGVPPAAIRPWPPRRPACLRSAGARRVPCHRSSYVARGRCRLTAGVGPLNARSTSDGHRARPLLRRHLQRGTDDSATRHGQRGAVAPPGAGVPRRFSIGGSPRRIHCRPSRRISPSPCSRPSAVDTEGRRAPTR